MEKKDYLVKQQERGARSKYILKLTLFSLSILSLFIIFGLLTLPENDIFRLLIVPVVLGWGVGGYRLLLPLLTSKRFEENFVQGKRGEEEVAEALSSLPSGFAVFHDLHFGKGGNIDFVVTGPCGVVAVEVKNYRVITEIRGDKMYIGGRETRAKEVFQTFRSSMAIKEFLESKVMNRVYVTPVLTFTSELEAGRVISELRNVYVVKAKDLTQALISTKRFVKLEELEKINRILALIARRQIL